jgi:hypothetical protein
LDLPSLGVRERAAQIFFSKSVCPQVFGASLLRQNFDLSEKIGRHGDRFFNLNEVILLF